MKWTVLVFVHTDSDLLVLHSLGVGKSGEQQPKNSLKVEWLYIELFQSWILLAKNWILRTKEGESP